MASLKTRNCFLCGRPGSDSTEHVVPRCIYGGPLPNDVVTLPAHAVCNRKTSKQEEAFRNFIAAGIDPKNPGFRIWETTWRSFQRPDHRKLKLAYFRNIISRDVVQPDGSLGREPYAVATHGANVDWVLAKMVKGLFARETNRILPNRDVRWKFGYLRPDGEKDVWLPRELNLHDVVKVRWGQAEEDPFVSVWVISIYSEHSFTVSTSPAARLLHNRKSGMKPMIWPGPNA